MEPFLIEIRPVGVKRFLSTGGSCMFWMHPRSLLRADIRVQGDSIYYDLSDRLVTAGITTATILAWSMRPRNNNNNDNKYGNISSQPFLKTVGDCWSTGRRKRRIRSIVYSIATCAHVGHLNMRVNNMARDLSR